jgi:hypothetical protein
MKEEVKNGLEDLYTDYLMVSTGPCTATGLSKLSTGENTAGADVHVRDLYTAGADVHVRDLYT